MKAYCINLAERKDRWDKFTSQPFPFDVVRFDAIKGSSDGCLKSHLSVLSSCKDEILIMEDDCHVLQDWKVFFDAYSQLPEDWSALYLGAILHDKLERYSDNLFKLKRGWATHGILYSRKVADYILKDGYPIIRLHKNYDNYMARVIQKKFKCFIIYPLFATQYPDHSDIINAVRECADLIPRYENNTR